MFANLLIARIRYAVLRTMILSSRSVTTHTFMVTDLLDDAGVDQRFMLVDAALRLIQEKDPRRLKRLRRDINRIVFLHTGPEFWPTGRVCVLYDVSNLTAAEVALHLIHEGTHARISGCGISYVPARRARIERACVRQEMVFLQLFPDEVELGAYTASKLDHQWWSDVPTRARQRESLIEAGAPRWLLRWFDRRDARRHPSQG